MLPSPDFDIKALRRSISPPPAGWRPRTAEKFSQLLDSDAVTVYVGPAHRRWLLPQNLLCDASPFFRGALATRDSRHAHGAQLFLPEDSVAAFTYLVQFMYGGTIDHHPTARHSGADKDVLGAQKDYAWAMMQLYVLASKLRMTRLKNLAMDRYRAVCRLGEPEPSPDEITDMLELLPPSCKFRNLLVQFVASTIQDLFQDMDVVQYDDDYFADTYMTCFDANRHFQLQVFYACSHGIVSNPFSGPDHLWHSVE